MAHDPDPADELYLVPPAQFVAARNQLAAALKKAGKKADAEVVKALAKPPVSVWAINQVARRNAEAMARFLEASDQLRAAQVAAGSTAQARQGYQDSLAKQRDSLQPVLAMIEQVLTEAGLAPGKPVLDRVVNDLRWGAVEDQTRALLAQGRLLDDVAPTDFSALVGHIPLLDRPASARAPARTSAPVALINPPASSARPAAARATPAKPTAVLDADPADHAARDKARQEAAALRVEVKSARSFVHKARQTVAARKTAHERALAGVAEHQEALAQAEAAADQAKRALDHAEQLLAEQERTVERLSAGLQKLEERLL